MPITNVCAVMPAYNQAQFLNDAIDAVVCQVDRLVVVNDGSDDETQAILDAREDIDKILLHPNSGSAAAPINAGVDWLRKHYSFEWLTWVSSDNRVYPHWIKAELAVAGEGVGAVYSAMDVKVLPCMLNRKKKDHRSFRPYSRKWLHDRWDAYFGCSFIIREELWPNHRGLMAHDFDHWMRVEEQCWLRDMEIVGLDEALAEYRVHSGMATFRGKGRDAKKWWHEGLERRNQMGLKP